MFEYDDLTTRLCEQQHSYREALLGLQLPTFLAAGYTLNDLTLCEQIDGTTIRWWLEAKKNLQSVYYS